MSHPLHPTAFRPSGTTLLLASLIAGLVGTSATAAPPDAGSLLNQQQSLPQALKRLPTPAESTGVRPAQGGAGAATVRVQSVRITGAEGLATEAELNAVVQSAIGQETDFDGLQQLAEQVSRYLVGKGWLLAQAYLPQQDLTAGALEIAVQQSRIESCKFLLCLLNDH